MIQLCTLKNSLSYLFLYLDIICSNFTSQVGLTKLLNPFISFPDIYLFICGLSETMAAFCRRSEHYKNGSVKHSTICINSRKEK